MAVPPSLREGKSVTSQVSNSFSFSPLQTQSRFVIAIHDIYKKTEMFVLYLLYVMVTSLPLYEWKQGWWQGLVTRWEACCTSPDLSWTPGSHHRRAWFPISMSWSSQSSTTGTHTHVYTFLLTHTYKSDKIFDKIKTEAHRTYFSQNCVSEIF